MGVEKRELALSLGLVSEEERFTLCLDYREGLLYFRYKLSSYF